MQPCIYCQTLLPERATFCSSCAKQVRCKQCRDLLEPNAKACISCGTLLGEGTGNENANSDTGQLSRQFNTYHLKETRTSREITAVFSDFVADRASNALDRLMADGGTLFPVRRQPSYDERQLNLLTGSTEAGDGTATDVEAEVIDGEEEKANSSATLNTEAVADRDYLRQIFYHDGERLVLDDLRLKASTQLDAARRLVYLFLYSHELEGRRRVARDAINEALKDVGLHEPHIITWISTTADLREETIREESGQERSMFRLRKTGREEAQRILKEMLDQNVPNTWPLSDRSRTRSSKSSGSDSGSSDKASKSGGRGRKSNPQVDTWVANWNNLNLGVDGHSIASNKKNPLADRAVFGLWAIRRATSDAVKVVSAADLASFIHKAFVVKLDRSDIRKALMLRAKGKVIRVQNGFEINPTGMQEAQKLAGLTDKTETGQSRKAATKKK